MAKNNDLENGWVIGGDYYQQMKIFCMCDYCGKPMSASEANDYGTLCERCYMREYYNELAMEYVVLLDYSDGEIIKIKLSEQETILADEAEDYEEFLRTLEEKYDFRLDNCCWMSTTHLKERSYL